MKKLLLILFVLLLVTVNSFAVQTVNVVTGYGYLTNGSGHIFAKTQYPIGTVVIPDGVTYTEVASQSDLNAVVVYVSPVNPIDSFNTDNFVQQLSQTSLLQNPTLFSFYAVMKDMTYYKNFQGLANTLAGLLQSGAINQSEVDIIDNTLENQQINLDSYNSQVNVSY